MANLYNEEQDVQILTGEYQGRVAKIAKMASINGLYQYGLDGITETEGHLYAVHENEITDQIDVSTDEPQIIPPSSSSHKAPLEMDIQASIANPQLEEVDNVSSLLQKASEVAQGRELNFNQALQGILARLDLLDQRLETKEIKVIVEVQHVYPEKPDTENAGRVTGGYFTSKTGEVKWHNDMPATYSDEDRLYDPIEEIVDKARARISDINGNMLQVKDDEDDLQLNMGIFREEE